ncbi:MAG: hypothetical protein Q9209_006440 [Squamulea sp. 1 TL-2023]
MIRLLNAESCTLKQFKDEQCPSYVIISHRWAEDPSDEVVFDDMARFHELASSPAWRKAKSATKIAGACQRVLDDTNRTIKYLWMDTVCIKQDNPMELSTAINSMYRLYSEAEICFVYLPDYPSPEVQTLGQSDWFNRGWTLQELVAPRKVMFFDRHWNLMGDKKTLLKELASRTNIRELYLENNYRIPTASVSQRMSWMAGRKTTVPEDTAYCLLGIFDVNMPLLYGEGKERAFRRLQEEIMRSSDDHSLFAWTSENQQGGASGLLASSPDWFRFSGDYHCYEAENDIPYQMTNKGLAIYLYLRHIEDQLYVAALDCLHGDSQYLGVYLICLSLNQFCRIRTNKIIWIPKADRGKLQSIYVSSLDGINAIFRYVPFAAA